MADLREPQQDDDRAAARPPPPEEAQVARERIARGTIASANESAAPEEPRHDPDGIPPRVVGWVAFVDVVLAGTLLVALMTGSWGLAVFCGLLLVSVPVRLVHRARKLRRAAYPDAPELQE